MPTEEEKINFNQEGNGSAADGGKSAVPGSKDDTKKKKWDPKKHFKQKTGLTSSSCSKYPKLNHIQWYVLDKNMMDDIGSYPFGYPIGKMIEEGSVDMHTAGLAVLHYCPTIPGDGEAWRRAATRFETTVRAKNSRSATYSGNDLLMSQCCYASVYSAYVYIAKHFGLLKFYSYKNNYLTQELVTSLGCDYQDLVRNQANYREAVNQLGRDLMSLLFIKGMTLFDRWSFLNMNLFTDTDSAKTQIYQFKPTCVWKWTPRTEKLGSSLTGVSIPRKYTLQELIDVVRDCIDSLREDDDIKYMNADIAKAYPDNDVVVIKPIDATFSIELFGNSNIKDQIQNARIVHVEKSNIIPTSVTNSAKMTFSTVSLDSPSIGHTYVRYQPGVSTILTTDDTAPTAEDVIVKSRFMNTLELATDDSGQTLSVRRGETGSEVISAVTYFIDVDNPNSKRELWANNIYVSRDPTGLVQFIDQIALRDAININSFRWHCYLAYSDNTDVIYAEREYPADNFTVLGEIGLRKMNSAIAAAMLNVIPAPNTGVINV